MTGRKRCPICTLYHRNGYHAKCVQVEHMWPLGPLVERVDATGHGVAAALRCNAQQLRTAAEFGLTDEQSDRWATRIGLHPAQVWGPEWIDAALTEGDRRYLDSGWRQAWLWNEAHRATVPPLSSPTNKERAVA